MPVRFTGIRLLLVFVATNTIMILMLVTSMTSKHPWLAHVLPGQFQSGGNYSGYWVFFSLVLLVDAVTVLFAALTLLFPALRDITAADERKLTRHMIDRAGISEEAKESVLEAMRQELVAACNQLFVGRAILLSSAFFLVVAFAAMTLSFARALPEGEMFTRECIPGRVQCEPAMRTREVTNADIRLREIGLFTLDQISGAVLLDAPEIYDWHIGTLTNNTKDALFSHFVFSFRTLFGFMLLLTLFSLRFGYGQRPPLPEPEEAHETPVEEPGV